MPKRRSSQAESSGGASKRPCLPPPPQPEVTPSKGTAASSRLLLLPGEVLNKIYKFVLTAEDGKLKLNITEKNQPHPLSRMPLRPFRPYEDLPEFNTLKYVCHKLYKDTAALELKFNTLVFIQTERAQLKPSRQLLEFVRLCSPAKFEWIKTIELQIKALVMSYKHHLRYFLTESHLNAYTRVAQFCRNNPHINVKYVFNSFTWWHNYHMAPESRGFINQGIILLKALRDVDASYLNPEDAEDLLAYGEAQRDDRSVDSWAAPNLRFFPAQDEFDQRVFRGGARGVEFDGIEGGLEGWIEVAKIWAEDGF
ncbi:hypothetical protein CC86DRAFT_430930 [Ophiobolus disseminans]|uniref:Uncharacterized protein n=1 Tax=Ophiobolus disseminans TaxID=1469910 RepID=A0A6A7AD60_9PLEO|nr:hypothetical protein CC86DRAFT_430930 [Ophiobolus disseminans]